VRGCRDFLPEEKIRRDWIVAALKRAFEAYGFNPLETPALENMEILGSKYAGGAEILKETYKLTDQGKRELGLRYDLTVPLCRVVASNSRMAMPFKRYQIAAVWRDGPVKLGRYREFVQCDVDTIGVAGMQADAEMAAVAFDAFNALGLKAEMRVNNRKLLNALLERQGVPKSKEAEIILAIDKIEKVGEQAVLEELQERGLDAKTAVAVLKEFKELDALDNEKLLKRVDGLEGATELKEFLVFAKAMGVPAQFVKLQASLARGLSYYTGTVFEVFAKDGQIKSSLAAGGRYDELVGSFAGRGKIPAVGISFGLDVIGEALKAVANEAKKSVATVLVAPISDSNLAKALAVAAAFRDAGVNALVDFNGRSPSKNIEWANKQGIPFVAFVGDEEAKLGKVNLKDLATGREELLDAKEAAKKMRAVAGKADDCRK
ncbi:histidine--tRNA ligase, partial [Candidatus Micrarchaeota archaeon CG_4_10_14_0_8_um_filter_60_7]